MRNCTHKVSCLRGAEPRTIDHLARKAQYVSPRCSSLRLGTIIYVLINDFSKYHGNNEGSYDFFSGKRNRISTYHMVVIFNGI